MANTYTLIDSYTVGSGGITEVNFTSIPQTYTDLLVKTSTNGNTQQVLRMRFNSVSSSDYTQIVLRGSGAAAQSFNNAGWDSLTRFSPSYNNEGANIFSNNEYYIPNYTGSNAKSVSGDSVTEANSTTAYTILYAGLLNNSSAVTSINFISGSGDFNQYSTFYLYGISNS
jgi:hypothetical protein